MTTATDTAWVEGAAAPADAVDQMYAGTLDGVLLRGLLTAEECAAAMLAVNEYGDWKQVYPDPKAPKSIGVMLAPSHVHPAGPPTDVYFPDAERDVEWVRTRLHPLIPCLEQRLAGLAGGRPVASLSAPQVHRLATVRAMDVGYGAPPHIDAYRESPGLASLFAETDRATQLSWYVLLQLPGAGGELEVEARDGGPARVVPLGLGDGVLFDGGRLRHQVTLVESSPPRISVGGFAGLATRHDRFLFWG